MEKLCGVLEQVGELTGGDIVQPVDAQGRPAVVGAYRTASVLDAVKIGGKVLKRPICEDVLAEQLVPGRQACLYVWRNGRRPMVLGVRYGADRFLITKTFLRGSLLQMTIIYALFYGLGGAILSGIVGSLVLPASMVSAFTLLAGAAGVLMWWWRAWQLRQAYVAARAD
jgi:hypothetical protein